MSLLSICAKYLGYIFFLTFVEIEVDFFPPGWKFDFQASLLRGQERETEVKIPWFPLIQNFYPGWSY